MKKAKDIVKSRSPNTLLATVEANITTGMFIWAGYLQALTAAHSEGYDEQIMPGGQIEIARQIAVCIPLIENMVADELQANPGPGVWEYDVAEPLGAWIYGYMRELGEFVEVKRIVAKARELTLEFINQRQVHETHTDHPPL